MTALLVSVRDAREAQVALDAGVALIDVKEPRRGSLGAADLEQIVAVLAAVEGRAPVSAALGELLEEKCDSSRLPGKLQYAKLGLAGCAAIADWPQRWARTLAAMPPTIQKVAVVYADWRTATAPSPQQILELAVTEHCAAVLVDTFDKSRGGLLEHWPLVELAPFAAAVRKQELRLVLAGSLTEADVPMLLPLMPDYLAVRGAVCRAARTDSIDGRLVERLVRLVQ
jgi:uncharacterized protein (UPF0264 family)